MVYIVDSDPAYRGSLTALLGAARLNSATFADAETFLAQGAAPTHGCVLLDTALSGMSGLALQAEWMRRKGCLPLLFLSESPLVTTAMQAMRSGGFDFLPKTTAPSLLVSRIQSALLVNLKWHQAEQARGEYQRRLVRLSAQEHRVLALALSGLLSKQIAVRLGVSPRTVEGHRSRILIKTGVRSLLELVHLARSAGITLAEAEAEAEGAAAVAVAD